MSLELAIKEQTEVMRQLIAVMQSGKPAFLPETKPQPKAEVKTKETDKSVELTKAPNINDLELTHIIALAVLFGHEAATLTPEQADAARALVESDRQDDRALQADALYMAVSGITPFKALTKQSQLQICAQMYSYWDDLPTIDSRREYAEKLLNAKVAERPNIAPTVSSTVTEHTEVDPATLRKQAETLILQLAKGGYRNEAISILGQFNAQKLGQIPDKNLAEVISLAEKALEA